MPWFNVDDGFPQHPKVTRLRRGATRERAAGLWTLAGAWCNRNLTDGVIPPGQVAELGCTAVAARWLVGVGLWHEAGHDCDVCPQPAAGGYVFHEWTEDGRNLTRAEVLDRRAKRAAAGAKGGRASGKTRSGRSNGEASASTRDEPDAHDRWSQNGHGVSVHARSKTPAMLSGEYESDTEQASSLVTAFRAEALASESLNPPPLPSHSLTPNPLLALVCRRLAGDARRATTTDDERAELWAMWADVAGPGVDLEAELRLWLLRNAETDLRDPAGALVGWLRKAADRARTSTPLGCARCSGGWLPDDDEGRPVPCRDCRPHMRAVAS